ncbi:hypothetical protein MTX26_23480 [Bradyrhizobium sp. ISRA443]|uniref:hypothetical protein n=1 Tax=unclassified Bradyrhizobium TaxID=2631580 RepID=UPI00247A58F5|nr:MULTISPECIES: hypothetical protein [unclassified Bradyrhizobium]WGR92886.1 hypothetical protein MTX20_34320 [Bradyrhizobium sp. ISRA435]WGR97380.1 hypothetical protein MTX23_23480 [Bradyrhizobium sp. ISRA436]WGS04268.1 hypothetical protein MTX18_23475 [Bradyrhizobium sp. ISRA437]WGS11152.1 hypothetical protein MTX26_23480 [Bradyrhizobium sp. ISRA443]
MKRSFWIVALCLSSAGAWAGVIVTPRVSVFEKALNVILATAVPQMSEALRERTVKNYEDAPANKAQAIELTSAGPWRSTNHEDQSVAGDRALEGCQLRYGKPCALIAVNEEIVAEGQLISKDMPRLHYSGEFAPAQIPAITLATRLKPEVQSYFGAAEPKAMAIHPWGRLFVSKDRKNLRDNADVALANCNNDPVRKGRDGNCFLYALNNDVVISRRLQIFPTAR